MSFSEEKIGTGTKPWVVSSFAFFLPLLLFILDAEQVLVGKPLY